MAYKLEDLENLEANIRKKRSVTQIRELLRSKFKETKDQSYQKINKLSDCRSLESRVFA